MIGEYEAPHSGSVIRLYAALLLRQVATTDEILLREYGKRIADLSPKPIRATLVQNTGATTGPSFRRD